MRGSPFRMRWRTMLLSSLKSARVDLIGGALRRLAAGQRRSRLRLDLRDARVTLLLLGDGVRLRRARPARAAPRRWSSSALSAGGCQFQRGLPASATSSLDGADGHLHLLVAEHDRRPASLLPTGPWPRTPPSAPPARCRRRPGAAATRRAPWRSDSSRYLPSLQPTRAAPMGPLNGTPESASAAEAPSSDGNVRHRSPDRATAPSRRPAHRCRSRPETADGSAGRSGARSASLSRSAGLHA